MTWKKVLKILGYVIAILIGILLALALVGTVVEAAGLVDNPKIDTSNLYSKYPLENYQLDFFVDNSWGWLPWNWIDGLGKSIMYGLYAVTNFIWTLSTYISSVTGYIVQEAYKLDFISSTAESIGKNIQVLAGVTSSGFSKEGFYVGFIFIFIFGLGIYVAYTGLIKRETTKVVHAVINFIVVFILSASFIAFAPDYITRVNDFSVDISTSALELGTKIVMPDSDTKGKDSVSLIRDTLFSIQIQQPWLLLEFNENDIQKLGENRVNELLEANPNSSEIEDIVKKEIEDKKNNNLTITKTMTRLGMVVFLFLFNIGITIFVFLLTGIMIFSQVLFIIFAMFLPISFLLSMIPGYQGVGKKAIIKLFNTIMLRAGITLIITTAFSISSMFYSLSSGRPFFLVAFLQIVTFAGIYFKLGELMGMFGLPNDSQQLGRSIMRKPHMLLNRRIRRLGRRLHRTSSNKSNKQTPENNKTLNTKANHERINKSKNEKQNIGSKAGRMAGAVIDTKDKIKDNAKFTKQRIKDLPTQARFIKHSGVEQLKETKNGFKRGLVSERKARQQQRQKLQKEHNKDTKNKENQLRGNIPTDKNRNVRLSTNHRKNNHYHNNLNKSITKARLRDNNNNRKQYKNKKRYKHYGKKK